MKWMEHHEVSGSIPNRDKNTRRFLLICFSFSGHSYLVPDAGGSWQVSVGTLLAFTTVAISVLILRYVPPDEVPVPSSFQVAIDSVSQWLSESSSSSDIDVENTEQPVLSSDDANSLLDGVPVTHPRMEKAAVQRSFILLLVFVILAIFIDQRRKAAGWTIVFMCVGVFILTCAASILGLPDPIRFTLCGVGGLLQLCGLIVRTCIDQDDARHNFGHTGGFTCPLVPLLPIACILINSYLLINLGGATWMRVSLWLALGMCVYAFYGGTYSSLQNAVYVPATHIDEFTKAPQTPLHGNILLLAPVKTRLQLKSGASSNISCLCSL